MINTTPTAPPCVIYQVSADDLKDILKQMLKEERERQARIQSEERELPTIERREAAKMLNVALSTLWRWAKDGYLIPAKIGSKVLYRRSDIERMLTRAQEGCIL